MSRGLRYWQSQALDGVTPPWLINQPQSSSHEPPRQWHQGGGGRDGGKRMIQRLNEDRDRQKTLYLPHGADASKADRA